MVKFVKAFMFLFSLMDRKTISRTRINRQADIGSPCLVPFSSLKYSVELPPLILQNSWFLSKIFTHLTNLLPNPYLSNVEIRN